MSLNPESAPRDPMADIDGQYIQQDGGSPLNNIFGPQESEDVKLFDTLISRLMKPGHFGTGELGDGCLLQAAHLLRGRNLIPILALKALEGINEKLEKKIAIFSLNCTRKGSLMHNDVDEATFLDLIASCCIKQFRRLNSVTLVEIAIECYERKLTLELPDPEDIACTLTVLGGLCWTRSDMLPSLSHVETAIRYLEQAAESTSETHPMRLEIFRDLGLSHRGRFEILQETRDIDLAISYHAQAVAIVVPDESNPETLTHIGHLGNSHLRRFQRLGEPLDLDNAIACHDRASSLTPDSHPFKGGMLTNLGSSYLCRFRRSGRIEDLDRATECYTNAAHLVPEQDPNRYKILLGLGTSHRTRFDHTAELINLDREVQSNHDALLLTPKGHTSRLAVLLALGDSCNRRFGHLKDTTDLEHSLAYFNEAIELMHPENPELPRTKEQLAHLYRKRFETLGDTKDLDTAVTLGQNAASQGAHLLIDRLKVLQGLGLSFADRYERLGELHDLDQAIAYTREGLSHIHVQDPSRIGWLHNLGALHGTRLIYLGDQNDLDTATDCYEQAISLMPDDHPEKPIILHGLGNLHSRRFWRLGRLEDADKAVNHLTSAVLGLPDDHPAKKMTVMNLGLAYRSRFNHLMLVPDSDRAITYLNQALALGAEGLPERQAEALHALGMLHYERFKRLKNHIHLDTALEYFHRAVFCTPNGHPRKAARMESLGSANMRRFKDSGDVSDMENGIKLQKEALLLIPDGNSQKPNFLNNLATSYSISFERSGEISDLDAAIAYSTEAVLLTLSGDPRRVEFLGNLGGSHFARYSLLHENHDALCAAEYFRQAGHSSSGQPLLKFEMMHQWVRTLVATDSPSVLDAYTALMELIPQAVWLGYTVERRYEQVLGIGAVGIEAASFAAASERYGLALQWLEQGRSIVWGQLLELRTPLESLKAINPELGQEMDETARQLRRISAEAPDTETHLSLEQAEQEHRRLAQRWEQLVQQAQALPELQGFLRPRKAEELISVCRTTTIVVILVHEFGCQVSVLGTDGAVFRHMILQGLTYQQLVAARDHFSDIIRKSGRNIRGVLRNPETKSPIEQTLKFLWDEIAKPVLDELGYTSYSSTAQLPHITWCPTGPLVSLPLHAAGDYGGTGCTVFDYAVSSYTPNLSSLLAPPADRANFSGLATIGQASASGLPPLPGTVAELNRINTLAEKSVKTTQLEGDKATGSAVLDAMEQHSWVHLACHASQNVERPTASSFYLHDGPLSLSAITHRALKNADLAFLSACQTATGDHGLPEESVHLAAGMLMAGYRRVIATMWSINDSDAPMVAEQFYAYMLNEELDEEHKAARALHHAVRYLCAELGPGHVARWAPYIHLGL